jgi:hypothetical protein
MEKYIPGNLVGHGKTLQEVRRHKVLRHGKVRLRRVQVMQVSPTLRFCHLSCMFIVFITQVSRCICSTIDLACI